MKKGILFFCLIASLFTAKLWADTNADNQAAQHTIETWFSEMKNNPKRAGEYLLPQFMSIHTDGIVRDKTQEMQLMEKLHMQSYKLSNFQFTRGVDTIITTFVNQGVESIDNKSIDPKAAGRMAVLQKQNDKWLILAYANLDKIG